MKSSRLSKLRQKMLRNRTRNDCSPSFLIASQKWKQLKYTLARGVVMDDWDDHYKLLHYACKFEPPLEIVQYLVEREPNSVYHKDSMDCLPLHIASKYGASPSVVSYLLDKNLEASTSQNLTGKSPLHMVFCDYRWKIPTRQRTKHDPTKTMYETILVLTARAPESLLIEDNKGMSPLECAIDEEVDQTILKLLMDSSVKMQKNSCCLADSHNMTDIVVF